MAEPSSLTYSTAVSEQVFTHPVFQHPENRGSLHTQTKTSCILVKKKSHQTEDFVGLVQTWANYAAC